MTGNTFLMGRDFLPEEGVPGKDHEVILTHRLWEHLGADRNIIGKPIQMNSEPYTVVGVLAAGQTDRLQSQFVVPLCLQARADQSRLSLAAGDGPHEARSDVVAGAGRHGSRDQPHRARPPAKQQGLGRQRGRTPAQRFFPEGGEADSLAADGRRWFYPSHRLRQRCQPGAGQGDDATERSGGAHFAGRDTMARVQPVSDGEPGLGGTWRRARDWVRRGDHQDHDGEDAAVHSSFRGRCDPEYPSSAIHSVGYYDRRDVVRLRSSVASLARRSQ